MLKIKLFFILIIMISSTELFAQSSIQDDIKNFIAGEKLKFTTAGHSKSRGLNIQIDIPQNWKKKEGERPHIVLSVLPGYVYLGGTGGGDPCLDGI